MSTLSDQQLRDLGRRSIEIIAENQAPNGAYLASPTFPVYRYAWLSDGAFIADAMSRAGKVESAEAFFAWCDRILVERRDHIESLIVRHGSGDAIAIDEFLPTRFTVEGTDGAEPWTDFQLDGYGTWVWALSEHARRHGRPITSLDGALLSVRYAATFWDLPSYDWWEEFVDHRHTSTLAAIFGGCQSLANADDLDADLRSGLASTAAAVRDRLIEVATPIGHLPKWLGTTAVDASLISVATPFEVLPVDHPLVGSTVAEIERQLVHDGGVHRYADDTYYGGGEWLLLAGFLGWHYARVGRRDDAHRALVWMASHATPDGELPEQVTHHLLAPVAHDGWVRRWGRIATPLLWSHAMYLTLAIELGIVPAVTPR
jgi:GH15 family glucan-1,4-alpha-glucosidase